MQQVKKKQHYVWKKYLNSWSNNDQIFTLLKSSNKIINTNLLGVVQERFFYALEEYTEAEEIVLKELVERWSNDTVRELNMQFYHIFTSYSRIKRAFKDKDISAIDTMKLEHQLNLLKANAMEDSHMTFEKFGEKLIAVRKIEDLQFLENTNELLSTMIYLSFQYLRTKKMKEAIKHIIPRYDYLSDKFLNILPFIYAPAIANSLTFDKDIRFIFYDNKTKVDFITSDQPIINEKKHILRNPGVVGQMDLYYPLSPKVAIVIHYQNQYEKYKYIQIEEKQIIVYNKLMFDSSNEFVFASRNTQLEQYL